VLFCANTAPMSWWATQTKAAVAVAPPPETDRLEMLHEELIDAKGKFDATGRELAQFKREHAIVERGGFYGHSIAACRAAPGWRRSEIDRAWNGLWQRITRAATEFHSAQSQWADEKLKREKNNAKAKRADGI
jgi:hypothetical protein